MPISYLIPFGLFVALIGAIIYFSTPRRKLALAVIGVGLGLAFLTFLVIFVAATIGM